MAVKGLNKQEKPQGYVFLGGAPLEVIEHTPRKIRKCHVYCMSL